MTRTSNYNLIVVEGNDKVNLLTQMNPNTEKIDEVMKNNEKSGVQIATELLSGTVHAITRTVPSASMFKFTAVSNYTSGDTFTVDGKQVTALLTSGEALGTGAYIIGSEVLCSLKDTLLTVYTQGGIVKIAEDADKLGGNLPEYYAKQTDLAQTSSVAQSSSELARNNRKLIDNIMTFSENEVLIGKWIDGRNLYRKIINCGSLPNNTSKQIKHNISFDLITNFYGISNNASSKICINLPYVNISNNNLGVSLFIDSNNININTLSNLEEYNKTYVCVEYVK